MAQLAIKGHNTRGNEVIKILEMIGGENVYDKSCSNDSLFCYISDENRICELPISESYRYFILFTLEEFLEKFPYKIGDEVCYIPLSYNYTIIGMRWFDKLNEVYYKLSENDCFELDDVSVKQLSNCKEEGKEEIMEERKYAGLKLDVDQDDKLATEVTIDGNKITLTENYLIGKITKVDDGMLVEFVKKQPQYPKTYDECCEVLFPNSIKLGKVLTSGYNCELLKKLGELLICRDAYWKIAGEQMGLGKPWEPDWKELKVIKYTIQAQQGCTYTYYDCSRHNVLSFPTREMRDVFYDNFKELIESCKELL